MMGVQGDSCAEASSTTTDGVAPRRDPKRMRVRFQVSGGIGFSRALSMPRTIDANALADNDRQSLTQLVDETQFFSLPARIFAPRGTAGYLTCQLTIEHGDRRHSVAVSDPVAIAPLQKLIDVVRLLASR